MITLEFVGKLLAFHLELFVCPFNIVKHVVQIHSTQEYYFVPESDLNEVASRDIQISIVGIF